MKITDKKISSYVLEAHITLERPELDAYITEAAEDLSKQVKLDGFRKGKAPKDLVKKQINPEVLKQEALEYALGDSFTKAAEQEAWDVMSTSDLKILKNDENGLEYSVQVQLWPAIKLPELENIKVERKAVEVSEQEIQESLDTIRNMRATFLDKVDAAMEGDRVEVDFDVFLDGKAIEGGQSKNHPLIIGGKNFIPGFEEELIGMRSGDKKGFSLVAPNDYYEPKLAGKKLDFEVTLHKVQSVLKPAADDEFAKSLGKFESIDQLKENLKEGIRSEKSNKERQRLRLAILDSIISAGDVPAPETLVKSELDDMVKRFADDMHSRGMELSMYLARLKKTEDDLRKDWQKEGERQVRIRLVLRQIARENKISVTEGELEEAVKGTIAELMQTGQLTEDQVDPERIRNALAERILTGKTLDFVEKACTATSA